MKTYEDISGFFNFSEFYDFIASNFENGATFIEVGAWFGKSVIYLAQRVKSLNKIIKIYAVDTWEGTKNESMLMDIVKQFGGNIYGEFINNIKDCNVDDLITPIIKDSCLAAENFSDNSVDFIFLDADHSYEAAKSDILTWYPKVKSGGIISGHDYGFWSGVNKAVDELIPNVKTFQGTVWYYKKD